MEDDGRECTECGKKFWSLKALFGHMRCHPERQWRGINPPPNFRRKQHYTTQEDHEAAACLLLLANANANSKPNSSNKKLKAIAMEDCSVESPTPSGHSHFECSSCNKVFGSHQALGGHRASHKNVKGCFATTNAITARTMMWTSCHQQPPPSQGGESSSSFAADHQPHPLNIIMADSYGIVEEEGEEAVTTTIDHETGGGGGGGHKCGICLKVFPTGQALGGHKRCHWVEKGDKFLLHDSSPKSTLLDLNLPPLPPLVHHNNLHDSPPLCSSPLTLDLRLGL